MGWYENEVWSFREVNIPNLNLLGQLGQTNKVGPIRFALLGYVNQVGLASVFAKFQLPSFSRSSLKGPGGVVVEAHFRVQLKSKPSWTIF